MRLFLRSCVSGEPGAEGDFANGLRSDCSCSTCRGGVQVATIMIMTTIMMLMVMMVMTLMVVFVMMTIVIFLNYFPDFILVNFHNLP